MNQRGFTLIELLISITMLIVIIGILMGSLFSMHRMMEKGECKIESLQRKRAVLLLVEAQIQSAFPSFHTDQGERKSRFRGGKDFMEFASRYSIWRGTVGNSLVRYQIKNREQAKTALHIEERVLGTDIGNQVELIDGYESILFEYYLKNAVESGTWVDCWPQDEKTMPSKIRLHFVDKDGLKTMTIQVLSREPASAVLTGLRPVVTK
ncbi:MAG: hypothetical protein HPY65_06625 [Syntrophaceae bacterium]|nr:hypothetical protein [Syntrophaceae bacterium]